MNDKLAMHEARVEEVIAFIEAHIDRPLMATERGQIDRIPEQILHLLSAAITEALAIREGAVRVAGEATRQALKKTEE